MRQSRALRTGARERQEVGQAGLVSNPKERRASRGDAEAQRGKDELIKLLFVSSASLRFRVRPLSMDEVHADPTVYGVP
jgi:hypothetical protein